MGIGDAMGQQVYRGWWFAWNLDKTPCLFCLFGHNMNKAVLFAKCVDSRRWVRESLSDMAIEDFSMLRGRNITFVCF